MVKYRLSTPGMSRNCPRVASPSPARSTLMTSAPNQASNWVHVGPDWTWVKSRMRTPSNALLMKNPAGKLGGLVVHGLSHGAGRPRGRFNPYVNHHARDVFLPSGSWGIGLRGKLAFKFHQAFAQAAFLGEAAGFVADGCDNGRHLLVWRVKQGHRERDGQRVPILVHRWHPQHVVAVSG